MINENNHSKNQILENQSKIFEIVDSLIEKDLSQIKMILKNHLDNKNCKKFMKILNKKENEKIIISDFSKYTHDIYRKIFFEEISGSLHFDTLTHMDIETKKTLKKHYAEYIISNFFDQMHWLLNEINPKIIWHNSQLQTDIEEKLRLIYSV